MDPLKALATVAEATRAEPALLPKTADALIEQWQQGLSVLRFDGEEVVAHATLWHLTDGWYELGTVWVRRDSRGHHVSANMYVELFARHPGLNILATTTNAASIRIGMRPEVGLVLVPYAALPEEIRAATCCCPASKTEAADNRFCRLRDTTCFVRVTRQTWQRLGSPPPVCHPFLSATP